MNVLTAALGFITGPLLARALGASGRGDLAAITVPLSLAPSILGVGVATFVYRELPRGLPPREVIGSLGLPLLVIGGVAALASLPLADALAGGRGTVRTFLTIGFVLMPVTLVGSLLLTCLAALDRWRGVIVARIIPFAAGLLGIVVLYVVGRLTVATAAAATIAAGVLAVAPGLPLLGSRPRFRLSTARTGISFGLKGWLGGLAYLANLRLDQFLMITVVAPRELGLYAVATTIAGASTLATGALSPPLMTRIASGEIHLLPQAVRITAAATLLFDALLVLITPALLALLFGSQFHDAFPMTAVLLAASVPLAGASVLSSGLQADGAPLIPSAAEGIALVITVVGLVVLLGPLGGVGAAIVSFAAYTSGFVFQLVMAQRRTGLPVSDFVVPTRADLRWARRRLRGVVDQLTGETVIQPREVSDAD